MTNVCYTYLMLDYDGPGEAAAEMKLISAHACPPPDPAHGSDGGHAWVTSGDAARSRGSFRRRNSPSARAPIMAGISAMEMLPCAAFATAVHGRYWPFEGARL